MQLATYCQRAIRSLFRPKFFGAIALLSLTLIGRAHADTDYLYYSGPYTVESENDMDSSNYYYRYDRIGEEWDVDCELDGNWTPLEESPEDPGTLIWGQNWELSDIYAAYGVFNESSETALHYCFAHDTVADQWYMAWIATGNPDDYGDDMTYWAAWADPDDSSDYLYYEDDYRGSFVEYDTINSLFWDNLFTSTWDDCDYAPEDFSVDPSTDGSYLLAGDNWSYSMVGGDNYAYDSVTDTWYIENTCITTSYGYHPWEVTEDPN